MVQYRRIAACTIILPRVCCRHTASRLNVCAAVGRCLTVLHAELLAAGILFMGTGGEDGADAFWNLTANTVLHVLFQTVAYMDDVAIPILAKAMEITALIRTAIETAAEIFGRFQLRLNYKLGKTNLILRLAGPGKEAVQAEMEAANYHITCQCGGNLLMVPIVESYQHLGRLTTADRQLKTEGSE